MVPVCILVLAAVLRCYRLDGQSLWYDEGVSAFMTTRGPLEIAGAAAADIHPPLYYWLLAAWAQLFGRGEIALRSLSAVLGTMTVWVVWRFGRDLLGNAPGLATAALLAVSPLAVQYGQEVRMYALAGLLAAATTWAYARLARDFEPSALDRGSPHPRDWSSPLPEGEGGPSALSQRERAGVRAPVVSVGMLHAPLIATLLYALLATALLYTHYYGLLVLAAHQLHLALLVVRTRRWSIVPYWVMASGLVALLYLPWLPYAIRQTGYYPGLGTPRPSASLVVDALNVLSLGVATTRFELRLGLVPFLALAIVGLAAGHPGGRSLLLLWLVAPIAAIVVLSTTRPLYEPRFLMLVLPAWSMLMGSGAIALGRAVARLLVARPALSASGRGVLTGALAGAALGLLLVPTARSLASYYFDPAYARDDYRGLARWIEERERPGDAVMLTAPGQAEVFGYYYRGESDVIPLPAQRPIDVADTTVRLQSVAAHHRRVWLIRWAAVEADPDDVIGRWLDAHARASGTERFGRPELRLYEMTQGEG